MNHRRHQILILIGKDLANLRRNRAALSLLFLVPVALIYFMGQVWGINRQDQGPTGIPLAVVNASPNPAAATLLRALEQEKSFRIIATVPAARGAPARPLTEEDARRAIQSIDAPYRFALVIPRDLVGAGDFGLHLKILSNPRNEIETQTVSGILQKTIFSHVPQLLGQALQSGARQAVGGARVDTFNHSLAGAVATAFGGDAGSIYQRLQGGWFDPPPAPALRRLGADPPPPAATAPAEPADLLARLIRIDREKVVGANVKSPLATTIVGGWAMQFLLFALSSGAAGLFRDRDAGIFQRLLAGAVTRTQILTSRFLYGVLVGVVQIGALFCAGRLFFGIDVEHHIFPLLVVGVFAAAACTAFGMALAAIAPNAEAASGLATFLILMLSAVGGAWFPVSLMPAFVQKLSHLSLVFWSIEGFSAVLWAGQGLREIAPILLVLGLMTAAVMGFAVWRFNRGRLFD